jgi:hypothetical protein
MYQRRLSTIILVVLLVLVLVFPVIGDAIRGFVAYMVGEKGERIVSVLAGLVSILAVLFGPEIRQGIRGRERGSSTVQSTKSTGESEERHEATNAERTTQPDRESRARIRDEARKIATELNEWIHERRLDDPFTRSGREGNHPEMGTPEYQALEAAYNNHIDETKRQYQNSFLPQVAQVRAALATYNIRDSELNRVYGRPRNYNDYQVVTERLWEMAGSLDRHIGS